MRRNQLQNTTLARKQIGRLLANYYCQSLFRYFRPCKPNGARRKKVGGGSRPIRLNHLALRRRRHPPPRKKVFAISATATYCETFGFLFENFSSSSPVSCSGLLPPRRPPRVRRRRLALQLLSVGQDGNTTFGNPITPHP